MLKTSLVFGLIFFSLISFSQDIDVVNYRFIIDLSDENDTLHGDAFITIFNKSGKKAIGLDLTGLDKDGKGMKVYQVTNNQLPLQTLTYKQEGQKLIIQLPDTNSGKKTLHITYAGIPQDGLIISKNKYGDRTFFSDNWPNRAHYWIPCNDRPDDKASFEFIVNAPSEYKVISNGVKAEEFNKNGKTVTHWKENIPLPTKVMVIGVAKFAVKTFNDSPPNIPVSAWIYQQDSTKGFHDYAVAPEILKFFSSYIAPYPYEKLANVQSKTIFGGMENASAIFYAENSVSGHGGVEDLLAHEIAHQWFGDMASEKSFTHLWLSEGFATYFTDIYWQQKYGDDAFKKRLQNERDDVVEFVKKNNHPVVDSLSTYMDLLNANSYQKGSWVLHMLRNEVGDSVFHKIIQAYYQRFKGGNADTRDFEAVGEKVSGKNLKWFFDQWLYRPGVPQLKLEVKKDKDEVKIKIIQEKELFQFPLEYEVFAGDEAWYEQVQIKGRETELKFKLRDFKQIILDPRVKLLFTEVKK